ncbi:MAG: TMEM165/GDT1 family protein [Candidatus Bipolaricaulota bacterium]
MVFLAELGDKTQLAILAMATQRHPGAVFIGAASALLLSTALAVLLAWFAGGLIPEGATRVARWAAGALFIAVGV